LSAPTKHLLANAAGAYIRIEGDNIELGAPGKIEFRASQREWVGPASVTGDATVPSADGKGCAERIREAASTGAALV
jgi:uncharacterized protein (DUF2345 family)